MVMPDLISYVGHDRFRIGMDGNRSSLEGEYEQDSNVELKRPDPIKSELVLI